MRREMWFAAAFIAAGLVGLVQFDDARATAAADVQQLVSPAQPGSAEPFVAAAKDGRIYMSWFEPAKDSAFALKVGSYRPTTFTWNVFTVRTGRDFFVNWADFPSIQLFGDKGIAAHWLQRSGADKYAYGIRVAISRDGGATWGEPVTPHTDASPTEHGFVAMWPEGDGIGAAWLDGRRYDKTKPNPPNEMSVGNTRIAANGARGAETMLDSRACDCCQVAGTMTSEGPIVAYRDRSAEEIRDIAVTRRVKGAWTEPALVNRDGWKIPACPVNGPAIAANGRNVALAWFTAARDTARVNVAFSSDAGATWSAPTRVDQGMPAGRVDLALSPDGSAIVSWIERLGGDSAEVRVRRVSTTTAGTPLTIAGSSAARASGFPRMAVADGYLYMGWTQATRPSQVRFARVALTSIK